MSNDLKPCPNVLCEAPAKYSALIPVYIDRGRYRQCLICMAKAKPGLDEDEANEKWNTRPSPWRSVEDDPPTWNRQDENQAWITALSDADDKHSGAYISAFWIPSRAVPDETRDYGSICYEKGDVVVEWLKTIANAGHGLWMPIPPPPKETRDE